MKEMNDNKANGHLSAVDESASAAWMQAPTPLFTCHMQMTTPFYPYIHLICMKHTLGIQVCIIPAFHRVQLYKVQRKHFINFYPFKSILPLLMAMDGENHSDLG